MNKKQIIEEYKYLQEEYLKIEHEINKKFCLQSLYIGTTSIILENITNLEIISSLGLGMITYFGIKNMFDDDTFFYPLINHSLYKNILNEYQLCIKKIAQTIGEIEKTNPAFIAGIYQTLLKKGYFSYNKQINNIEQKNPNFLIPPTNFGLNITNGIYTNKNIAIHFRDILNQLNIDNAILPIFINDNIELNNLNEQETQIKNSKLDKLVGNYWLNICKANNNNEIDCIDILNNSFYQKDKKNHIKYFNKSNSQSTDNLKVSCIAPIKLSYESLYQLDQNKEQLKKLLKYKSTYAPETYKSYFEAQKYVIQNLDVFENLYQNTKHHFTEIHNNFSILRETIIKYEEEKRTTSKIKIRK